MSPKRYVPLAAALILIPALTSRYSAAPTDAISGAPARIAAVTVYQDRAVVTRTISVDLKSGENTVSFEHLPAALMEESLNASARGVAGASILDVGASNVFTEVAPNEKVKAIEDEIKGFLKQVRVLDDRAKVLDQQRSFVDRMLTAATTVAPTGGERGASRPSLEEWQKLMTYSDDTMGRITKEQQSLDAQREELQARKSASERALSQLRGARGRQSKTVSVRMGLTTPGKLDVSIQYAVPDASWTPSYDARLASTARVVELSYFGVVRNGTGEDWKDVHLTLSTARPGLGGGAPELQPWITVVRGRGLGREYDTSGGLKASLMDSARDGFGPSMARFADKNQLMKELSPASEESLATVVVADVESGVSSATFKIPVTVSVQGNNVTQKVGINTTKLTATLQYQATPKAIEAAFLSANAVNGSDYPLLAGPMNTFLDDTFIAASSLKTVMPGEKFDLSLGADDGIKVKRRVVNRFQEDTGLTGKNRRVTYEILVSITNNKPTAEKVVFKEPTPVSRDEKVVVKVLTPTEKEIGTVANPKEVSREEDGKLVWRVNLDPGKKREFTLKFSVEYPGDVMVSGLE